MHLKTTTKLRPGSFGSRATLQDGFDCTAFRLRFEAGHCLRGTSRVENGDELPAQDIRAIRARAIEKDGRDRGNRGIPCDMPERHSEATPS